MNTVPKTLIQHFRFRMVTSLSFMLVVFVLAAVPVPAQEPGVQGMPVAGMGTTRPMGRLLFRETFDTLDRWRHESFPKIGRQSRYEIVQKDGQPALHARAEASASFLLYDQAWSIREYPLLGWSWLVQNVYEKGDGTTKAGDDFPLRIYVLFEYDPGKASFGDRLVYGAARLLYGQYPPYSSLSYVWESRGEPGRIIINPYSDRARQVVLRSGESQLGLWLVESVDVLADYRRAFGTEPPDRVTLAIMSDADNTGESASGYFRYIETGAP
jgi:hypothetical protein